MSCIITTVYIPIYPYDRTTGGIYAYNNIICLFKCQARVLSAEGMFRMLKIKKVSKLFTYCRAQIDNDNKY